MTQNCAVELRNISKSFGPVHANDGVSFDIRNHEILALLGENGSGKTTVMNMLAGIYYPDDGDIIIRGEKVSIQDPSQAYELGIGMVHQHYKLIDVFSALENIVLGLKSSGSKDMEISRQKAQEICQRYGFELDLDMKVYDMSVSQKQTLEIVKVLYRGADILILDEPTSVLTPQEIQKLFNVIRNMRDDGKAIVIITHKLNEVMEISDRVTVLRKGKFIATVNTAETDYQQLTELMVGEKVSLDIRRDEPKDLVKRLDISHLTVCNEEDRKELDDVSFQVFGGEILGIAGIAGSGQKELLEAIAGLQKAEDGASVIFDSPDGRHEELIGKSPRQIRDFGVHLSFVPEDRLGMGLVGNMGMVENMMLKNYGEGNSLFVETKAPNELAQGVRERFSVDTPGLATPVRKLSGGNVQKVLVGREIALSPTVLLTAYAVRGLDINTSYAIYNLLNEQKKNGVAVVYVGEDLDVLLALCDRILVLCGGRVNGILDARTTTKEEVGLLMTSLRKEAEA